MVLNIMAVLVILGITFMHSLFGAFSGLIDLFCAIVAMVVGWSNVNRSRYSGFPFSSSQ